MENTSDNQIVYRVMLVDDSAMIRAYNKRILSEDPEIQIVGEAENGKVALEKVIELKPDVILLDIEMPEMDGLTALPQLLKLCPGVKVIMVSTLTKKHADVSINALVSGASDYMEKPSAETDKEKFKQLLITKIKALHKLTTTVAPKAAVMPITTNIVATTKPKPKALAIGSSTGGPQALTRLFEMLDSKITDIPIFITQHMPPMFTTFLASSISKVSETPCIEATDGLIAEAGKAYLAPGDFHMTVESKFSNQIIRLNQNAPENFCRPAVDPMLRSLKDIYGKELLVVILTGMGQDGLEGVRPIFEMGGQVLIQDKESSVIWGMPGAIEKAGLYDGMYPLEGLAAQILKICNKV
jgi:two-component system chemotaxis response regulator CheB